MQYVVSFIVFSLMFSFQKLELEKIILSLPLEFRGTDPVSYGHLSLPKSLTWPQQLRRNMEGVIEGLLDAPEQISTRKPRLQVVSAVF